MANDTSSVTQHSAPTRDDGRQRLSPSVQLDPARIEADETRWLERSRAAWDARAERWDARSAANALAPDRIRDLDRIWDALRLSPGARVLDAGCGSGQFAIALAERGARVTGIDLSPEMIRRARDHAADHGFGDDIEWRTGDVKHLSDPLAVFDAVYARVLFQFLADIPATLRELRRVLKPGGRLLASVPGALSPIYRASWMRHLPGGDPGHNYLLPWELDYLLQEYGWRILDGWGEWGDDLYGDLNDANAAYRRADRAIQQATATTWTVIAA